MRKNAVRNATWTDQRKKNNDQNGNRAELIYSQIKLFLAARDGKWRFSYDKDFYAKIYKFKKN